MQGYRPQEVSYHAHLLIEAGLAQGFSVRNHYPPQAFIMGLTGTGREFAVLARDELRWNDAVAQARSTGSVKLDTLKQFLFKTPQNTP